MCHNRDAMHTLGLHNYARSPLTVPLKNLDTTIIGLPALET